MLHRRRTLTQMHNQPQDKWYRGYPRLVFLESPEAAAEATTEATPEAAAQNTGIGQATTMTQAEIEALLKSPVLSAQYSPDAFEKKLLRGVPVDRQGEALAGVSDVIQQYGSVVNPNDIVGSLATAYNSLTVQDAQQASHLLYSVSMALGQVGPAQHRYHRASPNVVRTVAERTMLDQLNVHLEEGNLRNEAVTIEDIRGLTMPFTAMATQVAELEQQMVNAKVDGLIADPRFTAFLQPYVEALRTSYGKSSKQILRMAAPLPDGLAQELQKLPSLPFSEVVTALNTSDEGIGVLKDVKQRVERRILKEMKAHEELVDEAVYRELVTSAGFMTAEQIQAECGIQPGSVISINNDDGEPVILTIDHLENRVDRSLTPPTHEEGIVVFSSQGKTQALAASEFMNTWKYRNGRVLLRDALSREQFAQMYGLGEAEQKASRLYVTAGGSTYVITNIRNHGFRFGKQQVDWTEFASFLQLKGHEPSSVKFMVDLDDKSKKALGPKKAHRAKFWDAWKSMFVSPRNIVDATKNVFNYYKDNFEGNEKERGLTLLMDLLPPGIFRDEIEAKVVALQDESMQSQLSVLKKRTATQVANSALLVFKDAHANPPGNTSLMKAYLLALLEKGGELYYGALLPYKNSFFIYEALGGRKHDKTYNMILEREQKNQRNPNLRVPPEWRCILEYMEQDPDANSRYGPVFFDVFDGTYNAAKGPQMEKQQKQLEDVNYPDAFAILSINEVYSGRFWRVIQSFNSCMAREMGVGTSFELFFHLLAFGNQLEDKERKEIKTYGFATHMPFLSVLGDQTKTDTAQRAMAHAVRYLAQSPKYANNKALKDLGLDWNAFAFDFSKLTDLNSVFNGDTKEFKKVRDRLSTIYKIMGPDIMNMMSGTDSFKIFSLAGTDPASGSDFAAYNGIITDAVSNYEHKPGTHENSTLNLFTMHFENPSEAGGAGIANQLLAGGQMSGSFTMNGKEQGKLYLRNFLNQMKKMQDVITTPGAVDGVTGQPYSDAEREVLGERFLALRQQLKESFIDRMDPGVLNTFLKEQPAFVHQMRNLGMTLPVPESVSTRARAA